MTITIIITIVVTVVAVILHAKLLNRERMRVNMYKHCDTNLIVNHNYVLASFPPDDLRNSAIVKHFLVCPDFLLCTTRSLLNRMRETMGPFEVRSAR